MPTTVGRLAPLRMPLHPLASLSRQHRHGVHPSILGKPDHPQVRQHCTEQQLGLLGLREAHFAADCLRKKGYTGAVGKQITLGGTHHFDEGLQETHIKATARRAPDRLQAPASQFELMARPVALRPVRLDWGEYMKAKRSFPSGKTFFLGGI